MNFIGMKYVYNLWPKLTTWTEQNRTEQNNNKYIYKYMLRSWDSNHGKIQSLRQLMSWSCIIFE